MKCWSVEYYVTSGQWQQSLRAMIDGKERTMNLVSSLKNPSLDPKHPFSELRGVMVSVFTEEELWYALAEIERPLKRVRWMFFFSRIQSAVRVLFPDISQKKPVGIYIANRAEQQKLSALFRQALVLIEETA